MRNPGVTLVFDLRAVHSRRTTHDDCDDVFAGIKEEEFGDDKSLDQHD